MAEFNILNSVLFKKNVYSDLSKFLKKYSKVFIITSKTPKQTILPILSGFLNENNIYFTVTEINASKKCCFENIVKCCSLAKDYDCVLSLGAGSVCDTTKLVAKQLKIDYIVVPTAISHFGYFTNFAYLSNNLTIEIIECDYPKKVFIDENIIKNTPDSFIFSSLCFIFSFYETYINEFVKNQIFKTDNILMLNSLKSLLNKCEALINWLNMRNEKAIINLMDNIIELFTIIQNSNLDFSTLFLTNLMQTNSNSTFGKNSLMCSKTLISCYNNFWNQKIFYNNSPNYEKFSKILQKKGKNDDFFFNFINQNNKYISPEFFLKVKIVKPTIINFLNKENEKFNKIIKKLNNFFGSKEKKCLNLNDFFENVCYTSLAINNVQLNSMARLGYLNII